MASSPRSPFWLLARLFEGVRAARVLLAVAASGSLFLMGCGGAGGGNASLHDPSEAAFQSQAFRAAEGTRAAALRALDSLRRDAWQRAFGRLGEVRYRRHVRTEQLAPDADRVVAFEERTARHGRGATQVVQSDSSGVFDVGVLGRAVHGTSLASDAPSAPPADLARQVLPEEPSFLSERNRYAFQYRLLPDTSLGGGIGAARVVAVHARPGAEGEGQPIRRARLYLQAGTGQLVALQLHRQRASMLFEEDTRQFVRLRQVALNDSSAWLPAETRFETRVDMPLRSAHRFRAATTYAQYRSRRAS